MQAGWRLAGVAAWGQNREIHGNLNPYLLGATVPPHERHAWYGLGSGGDVSVYRVPSNLADNYGGPVSFHAFLRYRSSGGRLPAVH